MRNTNTRSLNGAWLDFPVGGAAHSSFVGKTIGPIDVFMLIITSFELLCQRCKRTNYLNVSYIWWIQKDKIDVFLCISFTITHTLPPPGRGTPPLKLICVGCSAILAHGNRNTAKPLPQRQKLRLTCVCSNYPWPLSVHIHKDPLEQHGKITWKTSWRNLT